MPHNNAGIAGADAPTADCTEENWDHTTESHNGWTDERGPVNRVFLEVDLSAKGEKLIPARLLSSAGHRRQRSNSALEPTALRAAAQRPSRYVQVRNES